MNENINYNIDIAEIDIKKYLDFLYTQDEVSNEFLLTLLTAPYADNSKGITEEKLRREYENLSREQLLQKNKEKNGRTFWKSPTEREKKMIKYNRTLFFTTDVKDFENQLKRSPLNKKTLADKSFEEKRAYMMKEYGKIHNDFVNGILISDYLKLSFYLGTIDFLKYLNNILRGNQMIITYNPLPEYFINKKDFDDLIKRIPRSSATG